MKTALLFARFLEFGMGFFLIYMSKRRKKDISKNKNQYSLDKSSKTMAFLGWFIVIISTYSIIGYLLSVFVLGK